MAPRKKAGPSIGSHVEVHLSDMQWKRFTAAVDIKPSVANRTTLPGGWTVREGLRRAIGFMLGLESGPKSREAITELKRFVEQIGGAYYGLRPETRELFDDQYAFVGEREFPFDVLAMADRAAKEIQEIEGDSRLPKAKRNISLDHFLSDIIFLIEQLPHVQRSFPSKAYYQYADEYPIYRGARAAVKIARELAETHAPSAVPKLKRFEECKKSTFVNKLISARHGLSFLSATSRMPISG